MKIIFSRKGFDSGSGGAPSPIVDGEPISLPIPGTYPSETTYGHLYRNGHCLGDLVKKATEDKRSPEKRLSADSECHNDPMFECGRWAFGQVDGAQTHLSGEKTGLSPVGEGDVFLFFGLFAYKNERSQKYTFDKHHRIFGCMTVEKDGVKPLTPTPDREEDQPEGFSMPHPHVLTKFSDGRNYEWKENNTLYTGNGHRARTADDKLRLTHPDDKSETCSLWRVPPWLREVRLTRHTNPKRWKGSDILQTVGIGQEFISGDISGHAEAQDWLAGIMAAVKGDAAP